MTANVKPVLTLCVVLWVLPAAAQTPLPAGEGKETVQRVCVVCHGSDYFSRRKRDRDQWQRVVESMETIGAKGSDVDFKIVVDYLVANFGISDEEKRQMEKVNVNKAAAYRISRALKLFPEDGEAIVAYREKNGDFNSLDDLARVPGIDRAKLETLKERIVF